MRYLLHGTIAISLLLAAIAQPRALAQATTAAPVQPIVPTRELYKREFLHRDPPFVCGQQAGLHYTTMVRVTVDAAGQPSDLEVEQTSGRACLDEIALAAARDARYIPATGDDGKPTASTVTVPVNQPFHGTPTPEHRAMSPRPIFTPPVDTGPCRLKTSMNTTIKMTVPVDGVPTGLTLYKSSGDGCLDRQAMKIVAQYRFAPAMKDGQPFEAAIAVSVNFQKF